MGKYYKSPKPETYRDCYGDPFLHSLLTSHRLLSARLGFRGLGFGGLGFSV